METLSNLGNAGVGIVCSLVQLGLPISFFYPFIRVFRRGLSRKFLFVYGTRSFLGAFFALLIWCRATDWLYTNMMAHAGTAAALRNVPYIHEAFSFMTNLYQPIWNFFSTIIQSIYSTFIR